MQKDGILIIVNLKEDKIKLEEFNFDTGLSGLKIAKVISKKDPKGQQRVLVRVLGVHQITFADEIEDDTSTWKEDYGIWALSCSPFRKGGDLPLPGDFVWILFPNINDPMMIVWVGFVRGSIQSEVLAKAPVDINAKETPSS